MLVERKNAIASLVQAWMMERISYSANAVGADKFLFLLCKPQQR